MRQRECGDNDDERTKTTEWNHQAKQKEQVIDAVEDVVEAVLGEAERCLVPARIQLDDAGITVHIERALGAARRKESKYHVHSFPQPRQSGTDGEPRLL